MRATMCVPLVMLLGCGKSEHELPRGTWQLTSPMAVARWANAATLLSDGRVLVSGGYASTPENEVITVAATEIFDPAVGGFSTSGDLWRPRALHNAVLLQDGRVLLLGGAFQDAGTPHQVVTASAEVFDAVTGTSTPVPDMSVPRADAGVALLDDGRVLVVGGEDAGWQPLATAEIFDPKTETWSEPFATTGLSGGLVAIGIGSGRALVVGDTLYAIYDGPPGFGPTRGLPMSRFRPSLGLVAPGRVFIAGDNDLSLGEPNRETCVYDLFEDRCSPGPRLVHARWNHAFAALSPTRFLLAGGNSDPASAEVCDASAGRCVEVAAMQLGRIYPVAAALPDGTVLVIGGATPSGGTFMETATAEIYRP